MLSYGSTTPQDYPEWSGFGRRTERECGSPAAAAAGSIRRPPMRIYIIANDGVTLCREAPATASDGEIVVASNEVLHDARSAANDCWIAEASSQRRKEE